MAVSLAYSARSQAVSPDRHERPPRLRPFPPAGELLGPGEVRTAATQEGQLAQCPQHARGQFVEVPLVFPELDFSIADGAGEQLAGFGRGCRGLLLRSSARVVSGPSRIPEPSPSAPPPAPSAPSPPAPGRILGHGFVARMSRTWVSVCRVNHASGRGPNLDPARESTGWMTPAFDRTAICPTLSGKSPSPRPRDPPRTPATHWRRSGATRRSTK